MGWGVTREEMAACAGAATVMGMQRCIFTFRAGSGEPHSCYIWPLNENRLIPFVVNLQPIMVKAKIKISQVPVSNGYKSKVSPLRCFGKHC